MKNILFLSVLLFSQIIFAGNNKSPNLLPLVNTFVGTAAATTDNAGKHGKHTEEYGQTLPAVLVPNGMNFMTPQTRDTEQKCIAPYYYKDTLLQGFRNSHWIVGGCTQDYGSMTLMPMLDKMTFQPEQRASRFSHRVEVSTPAFYSTYLEDYQIQAEMSATTRCAIYRFTFHKAGMAYIAVNPNSDEGEGSILRMRTGVMADGQIVANEMLVLSDTGAYGGHATTVTGNTGHKAMALYPANRGPDGQSNIRFHADVVYTNTPTSGAYRGYGGPQG